MVSQTTVALAVAAVVALALPAPAAARTIRVGPGASIQAAVDRARPGDTVLVRTGSYRERGRRCPGRRRARGAVVIRKDRIRLVARPAKHRPVILRSRRGQDIGVAVSRSTSPACLGKPRRRVRRAWIQGPTIEGFREGLRLDCATRFRVTHVRVAASRGNGVSVNASLDGRIDGSTVRRSGGAGFSVVLSRSIEVDGNASTANAGGFLLENSALLRVHRNLARGNSAGVISVDLPRRALKPSRDTRIYRNRVLANNRPRECRTPGRPLCRVTPGSGIALWGVDRHRVGANVVRGNRRYGIALVSRCTGFRLSVRRCARHHVEPSPDRDVIVGNTATANGRADLDWDVSGRENCWRDNVAWTSSPASLPDCRRGVGRPIKVGIGESRAAVFVDPWFTQLGLKRARLLVPWNAALVPADAEDVDAWLAAARGAGVEPFVHFTAATGSKCPADPCYLPSVPEYAAAFEAFHARWPSVRVFGVWNEANHQSQPTADNPARAAAFYRAVRGRCSGCQIVAADVLEIDNMVTWTRRFQARAGHVHIWGLHNYLDANPRLGQPPSGGTAEFLSITSGYVWLTETGGIVMALPSGRPFDEERAAVGVRRAFELAERHRERIQRLYVWNWFPARAPNARWDTGLVRGDGSPRPGYFAFADALRSPSFTAR